MNKITLIKIKICKRKKELNELISAGHKLNSKKILHKSSNLDALLNRYNRFKKQKPKC